MNKFQLVPTTRKWTIKCKSKENSYNGNERFLNMKVETFNKGKPKGKPTESHKQ